MADIRELVTLFTFKVEESGINQYKTAISSLKEMAMAAGKIFGLAFGAEKIYSFVDGLIDSGKEFNKIIYQIQRLAREQDDLSGIQDTLVESATMLHVPLQDVADTFKSILRDSQELKLSQDEVLGATENIYKAMRVERLNPAQMREAMGTVEMAMRRGQFAPRTIGRLISQSYEVAKAMADALTGGNVEELRALAAKKGGLTSEKFIEAMSKRNVRLDRDFANAPVKLSQALTDIYSRLTNISARLFKMIDNSVLMAKAITWAFNMVIKVIKDVIWWLGGAENAIRLFGIALAVIATIKIIPMIYNLIKGMNLLSLATWRAVLPWAAWAVAIAGVALVLEDLYVWMKGGDSAIGDLLGPFDEFMTKLKDTFNKSDFFAPIRVFIDLLKGDFPAAWEDLKKSLGTVEGLITSVGVAIALVTAAFVFWNTISFVGGIIKAIGGVATAVGSATTAIAETAAGFNAWNLIKFAGLLGQLALVAAAIAAIILLPGDTAKLSPEDQEKLNARNKAEEEKWRKEHPDITATTPEGVQEQINKKYGYTGNVVHDTWQMLKNLVVGPPTDPTKPPDTTGVQQPPVKLEIPTTPVTPGAGVGPGVLGPQAPVVTGPQDNSVHPTMNQTNNITVNLTPEQEAIAASIRAQMTSLSEDMVSQMARELTGASPRAEKPTQ